MDEAKVRLLVCDIDGTLVRHDKSLPEENIRAIRELVARGVAVALISARPQAGILPIARQLGLSGAMGAFNGGTIFRPDGTVLSNYTLPRATAQGLLEVYTNAGVTLWLTAAGHWLSSDLANPHTAREIASSGLQPQAASDFAGWLDRVDKLVAVCDEDAAMDRLEASAREVAGVTATVVRSQDYYLDATAVQANKGDGVAALAIQYGVSLREVAVIGDQANDVAMFRRAGFAIAMGQANEAVKAEAQAIAASNEQAGVADAIARFIMPKLG